jgi:hypothetical protein
MPATYPATRDIISREALDRIYNTSNTELDEILRSVNYELKPVLELSQTSSPSLVVNVGSITVTNTENNRKKTVHPLNNTIPAFVSGAITFPASGTGNITPSSGNNLAIALSVSNYLKIGVHVNSSGSIVLTQGNEAGTISGATAPLVADNTYSVGFIVIYNNAGTLQNITNSDIYQYVGSGAGGGSVSDFKIASVSTQNLTWANQTQ